MPHHPKIITMFAMSIKHILRNAGCQLAFIVQAFFMPGHYCTIMIWYPCTPVWSVNAPTAFLRCDRQRDRHGYLYFINFLLCLTIKSLSPLLRTASERPPTKRVLSFQPFHSTATLCAITPRLAERASGSHRARRLCATCLPKPYWRHTHPSGASKSRTAGSCSLPAHGYTAGVLPTARLTLCLTCATCFANRSGRSRARLEPPEIGTTIPHLYGLPGMPYRHLAHINRFIHHAEGKTGDRSPWKPTDNPIPLYPPAPMPMNLLQYLPDDNQSWIVPYAKSMGMDRLAEYYDKVFIMLYEMQPGESFRVTEKVAPKNYDLFMKCVYSVLCEFAQYGIYDHHIEEQGTVILRR